MNKRAIDALDLIILLPSLRISGGVQETLRLAAALVERGVRVRVLVLWKHAHESPHLGLTIDYLSTFTPRKSKAIWELPILVQRYVKYIRSLKKSQNTSLHLLLTHYTTFLFAWFSPGLQRFCFNQDIEWMFVPAGIPRMALRHLILFTSRRSQIITTNKFISEQYEGQGILPFAQASIWARPFWHSPKPLLERSVDIVMLLRHGTIKRQDLYQDLLHMINKNTQWTCAVITPDNDIYEQIKGLPLIVLERPMDEEIKKLYENSRIFVLLSDTEGFGLPPLEAMGSGCVPLCRDSGGVRCYLQGPLGSNLIAPEKSISSVFQRLQDLLTNPDELAMLSTAAIQVFEDGLQKSRSERESCFDRIAQHLISKR